MIAEPLTLYQCTGLSDAAAAAVLGPVRRSARDVRVRGVALGSGRAWDHESTGTWGAGLVRDVATQAYAQAGIEAGDADVLEVHDAFTIGEIVTLESMGLAAGGRGAGGDRRGRVSASAARRRSTRPAGCSRAGIRSAPRGSRSARSWSGSCAARRARGRPQTRGSRCWKRWAAGSEGSTATRASSPCWRKLDIYRLRSIMWDRSSNPDSFPWRILWLSFVGSRSATCPT